jgi:hypothetical protein
MSPSSTALFLALRRAEFLNPAFDSWSQGISSAIHNELRACGFIGSSQCSVEFLQALWRLDGGTPLFGDDFCTGWEYYSIIENDQIAALVTSFEAALRFERILPDGIPEEARKRLRTRFSDDVRKFLGDLIGWLGQIHQSRARRAHYLVVIKEQRPHPCFSYRRSSPHAIDLRPSVRCSHSRLAC